MTLVTTLVVIGGAFIGGFVSGLAGFGTGLVALGIWLHVLEPTLAASIVIACSIMSQLQSLPTVWKEIDRARVLPFIASGLVGVPLGTMLLSTLSPAAFRFGIGMVLICFCAFMLVSRYQPHVTWGERIADGAVGFFGGVLGGLAGLSGPLPTVWATLRGWNKPQRRSVFQAFNLTILLAALGVRALSGLLTKEFYMMFIVALPGTVIGGWLGVKAYGRLSDELFHRIVLGLFGFSGVTLVWAALEAR